MRPTVFLKIFSTPFLRYESLSKLGALTVYTYEYIYNVYNTVHMYEY
jgi:hypothetical protein